MGAYQKKVEFLGIENGWSDDLMTLGLGLCEEAGAINNLNPLYVPGHKHNKKDRKYQNLKKELQDVLNYLCAIANKMDIELGI